MSSPKTRSHERGEINRPVLVRGLPAGPPAPAARGRALPGKPTCPGRWGRGLRPAPSEHPPRASFAPQRIRRTGGTRTSPPFGEGRAPLMGCGRPLPPARSACAPGAPGRGRVSAPVPLARILLALSLPAPPPLLLPLSSRIGVRGRPGPP